MLSTCIELSGSMMWKVFVMGPFSINLTFNVLLNNQKENNLPTFFNCQQFVKKGMVQSTYCHL